MVYPSCYLSWHTHMPIREFLFLAFVLLVLVFARYRTRNYPIQSGKFQGESSRSHHARGRHLFALYRRSRCSAMNVSSNSRTSLIKLSWEIIRIGVHTFCLYRSDGHSTSCSCLPQSVLEDAVQYIISYCIRSGDEEIYTL